MSDEGADSVSSSKRQVLNADGVQDSLPKTDAEMVAELRKQLEEQRQQREEAAERERQLREEAAERERQLREEAAERERQLREEGAERERQLREEGAERERQLREAAERERQSRERVQSENAELLKRLEAYHTERAEQIREGEERFRAQLARLTLDTTSTECSLGSLWALKPRLYPKQFLPNLKNPPSDRTGSQTKSAPFPPLMKYFPAQGDGPVTRSAPPSHKAREEVGVFFWEHFDNHLMKAGDFKQEAIDGSGTKSVLEELKSQIVDVSLKGNIEGTFVVNQHEANDEATVTSIFLMSAGLLLTRVFELVVKQFHFGTYLSGSAQHRIETPALSKYFRPDLFWQLHGTLQDSLLDVAVLLELKVPWKFPQLVKGGSDANPTILQNLFQYYLESEEGRKSPSNVLMQIRAYLAVFQRKYGIICSLNCYTFVYLNEKQDFYVSDRYWVDQNDPAMSLIERLIRFILIAAAEGDKLEVIPPFMTKWLVQRGVSTSFESIHRGGQATASASSGLTSEDSMNVFLENHNAHHRQHRPFNWLDLQDPRRWAHPCLLSAEDRRKPMGELEGDAMRICTGRVGDVYVKEYDGIKTVSKLLGLLIPRDSDEGTTEQVLMEMQREIEAYDILQELQGTFIPRLLNCGYLIKDIIFVISTEWSGERIQINELSETQKQNAMVNLERIHELGVLHGDLNERNLLLKSDGEGGTLVFIDFGFAKLRESDDISPDEWTRLCSKEEDELFALLNPLTPQKGKRQRQDSRLEE